MPESRADEECPCCKKPHAAKEFSLCANSTSIGKTYGVGFPLLFQFIRFNTLMYFLMFIITGIFTMVISFVEIDKEESEWSIRWITNRLSVNFIWDGDFDTTEWVYLGLTQLLTYVFMITIVVYMMFQDRMVSYQDEITLSDADFSVMFHNLPHHATKQDIRSLITRTGLPEKELVYINMCYRAKKTLKNKTLQEKLIKSINVIESF